MFHKSKGANSETIHLNSRLWGNEAWKMSRWWIFLLGTVCVCIIFLIDLVFSLLKSMSVTNSVYRQDMFYFGSGAETETWPWFRLKIYSSWNFSLPEPYYHIHRLDSDSEMPEKHQTRTKRLDSDFNPKISCTVQIDFRLKSEHFSDKKSTSSIYFQYISNPHKRIYVAYMDNN